MTKPPPACVQITASLRDLEELETKKEKISREHSDILEKIREKQREIRAELEKCLKK
jgi:hypothetical protein